MSSVLDTVYNNYLTTYAPKSLTQYDTHKKSELRGVYHSIVKMNKDAPWYLPMKDKDTQMYAVSLKENACALHHTITELGGTEEDAFLNRKSVYSSDESIVTASYIGSQNPEKEVPTLELSVHSLATSQENLGLFLPDEKIGLKPDTYSFDVSINDINYEFQFSVNENETNRDVQERLVRLVNNSEIGIKAELCENEGRTSLRLTSDATGLNKNGQQIFNISDNETSMASGSVAYLGIDYVSRASSDASFSVNREERTSSSNHFTLNKLYEVTLQSITDENESVLIGLKPDVDSITDNINRLVNGYNDFVKATAAYLENQPKSKQLLQEMKHIAGYYGENLADMGITLEEDGYLHTDSRSLRRSVIEADNLEESFGTLKELSRSLLRKSNQVSLNPMNYVQKTVVAYKNPGHNFASPYVTSAYSGMMFNNYC